MAAAPKHVVVLVRRPPEHPRCGQGLRATVGYVLADLRVTLVLCGPAAALLDPQHTTPERLALQRPIATLRALGQRVLPASAVDLCALVAGADAVVTW